jgi:ribulose-phosphate 3-epimerase
MVKRFASLLSADASNYEKIIRDLEKEEIAGFHFDIMDGQFVKNFAFSAGIIGSLRKITNLPFDAHLEIMNPEVYIDMFIDCGCQTITIHPQVCDSIERELRYIRSKGKIASIALDPDKDIDAISGYINLVDNITVMSVYPGFGNQRFIKETFEKIRDLKNILIDKDLKITISVDGGINKELEDILIESGVDIFIYGSSLFKQ